MRSFDRSDSFVPFTRLDSVRSPRIPLYSLVTLYPRTYSKIPFSCNPFLNLLVYFLPEINLITYL